jgi:hypothetical protein
MQLKESEAIRHPQKTGLAGERLALRFHCTDHNKQILCGWSLAQKLGREN